MTPLWSVAVAAAVLTVQTAFGVNHLSQAVVSLIEQSYVNRVNVLSVYVKCKEDPHRISYFSDLTNSILRELDQISVRVGWQRELPTDADRQYGVFGVDTLESLRELCSKVFSGHFNIDGNIVIVLRTFTGSYYDVVAGICEENLKMSILNANVVVEPLPGLILMFTYVPYSQFACSSTMPVLINEFRDNKWQRDRLFPPKLRNLHGCSLICATWEDLPYFKIVRDDDGRENYEGIEGRLLDFISIRMNFKIQFYFMNDEEIEATVEESGLIFDEMFRNGVQFAVGAFHFKPTRPEDFFMPSNSYYPSTICIVVSSRRDPVPPLAKLMLPFTLGSWLFVLAYFSVGILVCLTARYLPPDMRDFILGSANNVPVYNMFYTALGGGVHRLPKRNFARFLLFMWLAMWLVLRSTYQSGLFHFIRTQLMQPLPESIEDILEGNYEVLMAAPTFDVLAYMPALRAAAKIINGTEVDYFPMLPREQRKIAILTPFEYFGYFRKLNGGQSDDFHIPHERVFTQHLSFYLKKSSFLVHEINTRIVEYMASGLQERAESVTIDVAKRDTSTESSTEKPTSVDDMYGAIEVFFLGSVISFSMFVVELLTHRFSVRDAVGRLKRMKSGR